MTSLKPSQSTTGTPFSSDPKAAGNLQKIAAAGQKGIDAAQPNAMPVQQTTDSWVSGNKAGAAASTSPIASNNPSPFGLPTDPEPEGTPSFNPGQAQPDGGPSTTSTQPQLNPATASALKGTTANLNVLPTYDNSGGKQKDFQPTSGQNTFSVGGYTCTTNKDGSVDVTNGTNKETLKANPASSLTLPNGEQIDVRQGSVVVLSNGSATTGAPDASGNVSWGTADKNFGGAQQFFNSQVNGPITQGHIE